MKRTHNHHLKIPMIYRNVVLTIISNCVYITIRDETIANLLYVFKIGLQNEQTSATDLVSPCVKHNETMY